jgi:hypothetical protein
MSNNKLSRYGKVLCAVGAVALVGCGPEMDGAEQQAQAEAEQAPAQGTVNAACTPTWDATVGFVSAYSPGSLVKPMVLTMRYCLQQTSACGTQTRTYTAYAENTGWATRAVNLTFTVGSGATACQVVDFTGFIKYGSNSIRGIADYNRQIVEINESNNTYSGSFTF